MSYRRRPVSSIIKHFLDSGFHRNDEYGYCAKLFHHGCGLEKLRLPLQLLQEVLRKLPFHVLGLALHDAVAEHGQLADDRHIRFV
jgi:hypothetical protein